MDEGRGDRSIGRGTDNGAADWFENLDSGLPPRMGAASFADRVRDQLATRVGRGPMLEHARTPAVLRLVGVPALPIAMAPGILYKIAGGKGGERPPLSARQIASIPELLDEAAAIYRLPGAMSLIVLSAECDTKGNPILVCVRPDVPYGVRRVNAITTAFGKDNAAAWAARNNDSLIYVGEKTNPGCRCQA